MAVINLVMEAMGTTRSASFTSNSSEVLASITSAIFDFTIDRNRDSWVGGGFLEAGFEEGVRAGGTVRVGAGVPSPLCAANTNLVSLP
jgi:hypothetical protein